MLRNILQIESSYEMLRSKSRELSKAEIKSSEIQSLIQEMKEIMRAAPGVGLAAPQIGVSIQLAVIEDSYDRLKDISSEILVDRAREQVPFHVIINPEITYLGGNSNYFFEGCLSIKGRARVTPRFNTIMVDCLNENGERNIITAHGWYARILQHEIGHLNGQLYIDLSDARTEVETDEEFRKKWLNASSKEIFEFFKHKCPDCIEADVGNRFL